jgi:hypothetical protein
VKPSRVTTVAISVACGAVGILLLIPGVLGLLFEAGLGSSSVGALSGISLYVVTGSLILTAGIGLFRERAWSRWLLLTVTCLAGTLLLWQLAGAVNLYQQLSRPTNGEGVTLHPQAFAGFFAHANAPFFGALVLAAVATVFAFRHFRSRNV